jgi:hypothetical protein
VSACACPCCSCDCEDCTPPPTPEELAADRQRAEARLAARMTPARDALEQMDRDIAEAMESMARRLDEAYFAVPADGPRLFSGLGDL